MIAKVTSHFHLPTPMPFSLDQITAFASPKVGNARLVTGDGRFAYAVCASFLLHVLLLTAYNHWDAAGVALLTTAPWTRGLSVTLVAPHSASVDSDQDAIAKRQTIVDDRAAGKYRPPRIDQGDESALRQTQTATSVSASDADENGAATGRPPPIDMDAARDIARQTDRTRIPMQDRDLAQQRALQYPMSLERETPLSRAITRSLRSDCRSAYAGAGLLALPLLVKDAVMGSGCRW